MGWDMRNNHRTVDVWTKRQSGGRLCAAVLSAVLLHLAGRPGLGANGVISTEAAVSAINTLGIELLAKAVAPGANAAISPFSIQTALAMTYAGAGGATRAEMARVLHYGDDDAALHSAFGALSGSLRDLQVRSAQTAETTRKRGGEGGDPVILGVANRLYGQQGFEFLQPFLTLVKETYGAPFEIVDFKRNAPKVTDGINAWVADQTHQRILNLIPAGALDEATRLVLVNALYFKAPWAEPFEVGATLPEPFLVAGVESVPVPTMMKEARFGYARRAGYQAVSLAYQGGNVQCVLLVPDLPQGLAALEGKLTQELLHGLGSLPRTKLVLHLPKFKLEPPLVRLGTALRGLGMTTAFDQPAGSADFSRMAAIGPTRRLAISDVFHKTFVAVDEKGTEAAAATASVIMEVTAAMPSGKPLEVRVDRPFLFVLQHRQSGACLFLGRVVDPR